MNKLIDNNSMHGQFNRYNFQLVQGLKQGESVYARNAGGSHEYYDSTFGWLDTHDLIQVLDFDGDQVVYLNKKTGKKSSYHWTRICSTDIEFQVYIESLDINFIHSFPVKYEKSEMYHHFEILKSAYGKTNETFEIPVKAPGEYFLEVLDKYHFHPIVVNQKDLSSLKSKLDKIRNNSKKKGKSDPSENPAPEKKKVVATKKEKPVKPVKATGNKVIEKPSIPKQTKPSEPKIEETKDDLIKFRCSSSFKAEVKRLCEKRGHNNVSLLMIEAINLFKAI